MDHCESVLIPVHYVFEWRSTTKGDGDGGFWTRSAGGSSCSRSRAARRVGGGVLVPDRRSLRFEQDRGRIGRRCLDHQLRSADDGCDFLDQGVERQHGGLQHDRDAGEQTPDDYSTIHRSTHDRSTGDRRGADHQGRSACHDRPANQPSTHVRSSGGFARPIRRIHSLRHL